MIDKIHSDYIQKSLLFLYPQLRIPNVTRYKPIQTYTGLNNDIHPAGSALILLYKNFILNLFSNLKLSILLVMNTLWIDLNQTYIISMYLT